MNIHKGKPEQFKSALENRIAELSDNTAIEESTEIKSSTSLDSAIKSLSGKLSHLSPEPATLINIGNGDAAFLYEDDATGTINMYNCITNEEHEFDTADELVDSILRIEKILNSDSDIESATNSCNIPSKTDVDSCNDVEDDEYSVYAAEDAKDELDIDEYMRQLMKHISSKLFEEGLTATYDTTDTDLLIFVSKDDNVTEYKVPYADLTLDFSKIDLDVDYILDEIVKSYDDVESSEDPFDALADTEDKVARGNTWQEFISDINDVFKMDVDIVDKDMYNQFITLYDYDGNPYEAEVTEYSDGSFELSGSNISEF